MIPFIFVGLISMMAMRKGIVSGRLASPILALMLALSTGIILILWAGKDPFKAYGALLIGAFGNLQNISETLVAMTPLVLTGLSIALAFHCGLFNIGAEGQFILGQLGAAWIGYALAGLPMILHLPVTLLFGMAAGALWALIPGLLKAYRGVHEVINTIMMNYIALYLANYLVNGPMMAKGFLPVSPEISPAARLPRLLAFMGANYRANAGIILAISAAMAVYYILWHTTIGYEIRAVGRNPQAARYGGINVPSNLVKAMLLSGALSGMAGAIHIMGIQYKFVDIFTWTGYGFDGIAVALLGGNHPVGVVLSALLFGALTSGAAQMQILAGVPKQIITIVQSIIILFVAAEKFLNYLVRSRGRNISSKSSPAKEAEVA